MEKLSHSTANTVILVKVLKYLLSGSVCTNETNPVAMGVFAIQDSICLPTSCILIVYKHKVAKRRFSIKFLDFWPGWNFIIIMELNE